MWGSGSGFRGYWRGVDGVILMVGIVMGVGLGGGWQVWWGVVGA